MKAGGALVSLATLHVLYHAGRSWQSGVRARGRAGEEPQRTVRAVSEDWPGVSVIIPAWQDADALIRTLPTVLHELEAYPGAAQLLIIAGGPDGTLAQARALLDGASRPGLDVTVLPQSARGKNAALNTGLRTANHDLLTFLDADTLVDPDWLPALLLPLVTGEAEATTGNFHAYRRTSVSDLFEVEQLAAQVIRGQVTLFGGGSIAVTRAALNRIGGVLPEEVLVGVDWDLSERLKRAGAAIAYCEDAKVRTEIAETWPAYWRGEVRWRRAYLRGQARLLRLERRPMRLLGLLYVPFVQATLLLGWWVLPLAAAASGRPARRGLRAWGTVTAWVLGRHLGVCLQAYGYSRDLRWLRLAPTSLLGFFVSAAASLQAVRTIGTHSAHFKGQRVRR